jgi:hypothetical protein
MECQSLFSLAVADADIQKESVFMGDFFFDHKEELHSFLIKSPLQQKILDYSKLREAYFEYSEKFLKILTKLSHDWQRKYYLIESDLIMPPPVISRLV